MILAPLAVWAYKLQERNVKEDLYEAVKHFVSFIQCNDIVIEVCYLYCYAIRLLINGEIDGQKVYYLTFEEAKRRASISNNSTIKYWIENEIEPDDVNEMSIPHERPISYIKIPFLWSLYYLKNKYTYD